MKTKILNITNGEYFNKYFTSKFDSPSVPFCEAMMDGETISNIFSEEFIKLRAESLSVSENEYGSKMYVYDALNQNTYEAINLWFGKDTFCQTNLLTLLAYLEQIEYQGQIKLNYINDETFEIIESNIDVKLGIYNEIYQKIMMSKSVPNEIGALDNNGLNLYIDYHSDNGVLANLVKSNAHKSKKELIVLLLEQSKDYGLSDLQAEKLIQIYKKS